MGKIGADPNEFRAKRAPKMIRNGEDGRWSERTPRKKSAENDKMGNLFADPRKRPTVFKKLSWIDRNFAPDGDNLWIILIVAKFTSRNFRASLNNRLGIWPAQRHFRTKIRTVLSIGIFYRAVLSSYRKRNGVSDKRNGVSTNRNGVRRKGNGVSAWRKRYVLGLKCFSEDRNIFSGDWNVFA